MYPIKLKGAPVREKPVFHPNLRSKNASVSPQAKSYRRQSILLCFHSTRGQKMPQFHPRRNLTPGRVEFPLFAGVLPPPEVEKRFGFTPGRNLTAGRVESAFSPSFRQCMGSCKKKCMHAL